MRTIRHECTAPLTHEEEIALFRRCRRRKSDREARETLCRANFALVIKLAGKFASPGLDVEELISLGLLKLVGCVENYDYRRGYRFSTYLTRALVFGFLRAQGNERRHQGGRVQLEDDDDSGAGLEDLALAEDTRETEDLLADLAAAVQCNRAGLTELELAVLTKTFFGEPQTPAETALALGLSRKDVISLTESAVEKLRAVMQ